MERLIVIDTNIVITYLAPTREEIDSGKFTRVLRLFKLIETDEAKAIIPEVALHETFYTLLGKRFPDTDLVELSQTVSRFLAWPGWAMERVEIEIYLRAISILQTDPKLEFSDAVIAARAEAHGAELATFDRKLAEAFGGPIWMES